jgi:hypothetical protein
LRYEDEPAVSSTALKRKEERQENLATRQKEKVETIYILEPHELQEQRLRLLADKVLDQDQDPKFIGSSDPD